MAERGALEMSRRHCGGRVEVVKKIGEVTRKNGREKETLPVWEAEKPMRGQPRWLAKS